MQHDDERTAAVIRLVTENENERQRERERNANDSFSGRA